MRKRLLLLSLLLTSYYLMAQNPLAIKNTTVFDLSGYLEKGLFITESNSVSFNYVPVAIVQCHLKDGDSHIKDRTISVRRDKEIDKTPEPEYYKYSVYDALDEFELKCKELKANAIINLKIEYYSSSEFIVTGMAVKK